MKETIKIFFEIMGLVIGIFFLLFFLIWTMVTFDAISSCPYYEGEGYVTYLHWDAIFLICDVALEYNDGNIVYVNTGSLGDTFVIENYGVRK